VPQSFLAYGSDLSAQGGSPTGCPNPKASEDLAPAAIAANVTAIGKAASANGNIVAYPTGGTSPTTSLINFTTAANIANSTIIGLCEGECSTGHFDLKANFANLPAIVDVQGYFYPRTPAALGYANSDLKGTYRCQGVGVAQEGQTNPAGRWGWATFRFEPQSATLVADGDGHCTYQYSRTDVHRNLSVAYGATAEGWYAYLNTTENVEPEENGSATLTCTVSPNGQVSSGGEFGGEGTGWLSLGGDVLIDLYQGPDGSGYEASPLTCVRTAL